MLLRIYLLIIWILIDDYNCANITIKEETVINTMIGNIRDYLKKNIQKLPLSFKVDSKFIRIYPNGEIILKRQIDLDTLCQVEKLCCGVINCIITTNILITNKKQFIESLKFDLHIDDINDNYPEFKDKSKTVSFSESCPINYLISLEPAIDRDFSKENRILYYQLEEPTQTFLLDTQQDFQISQIRLKVAKPLDYERKIQYKSILKACDLAYCTQKSITIDIIDENDNTPVFNKKFYRANIAEDLATGSLILQVTAKDLDSGIRGKIEYSIETNDPDLKNTFGIDSRSGQIRLIRKFDTKIRRYYSFYVVAKDGDMDLPLKEKVSVELHIKDVNNNPPLIHIISTRSGNNRIEVKENSVNKVSLCTIKVVDDDIGNNSKIACHIDKASRNNFELKYKAGNMFVLYTKRGFDYETEALLTVEINCTDFGSPPKTNSHNLLIHVLDDNEYQPVFNEPTYEAWIMENSASNKEVVRISATDRDGGAQIRYSLDKRGKKIFSIDSKTGIIRTTGVNLDREKTQTLIFNAFATDGHVDPRMATAKIIVTIKDENDNVPVFGVIPKFAVSENQISTRLKGKLQATDQDEGNNGKVVFVLLKTWAKQQELHRIFHVTEDGYLETLQSLDRETFSEYVLEVGVRDMGQEPLANSINITVKVLDENDNKPQWLVPSPLEPVINLTHSIDLNPGHMILKVRAFDPDEGDNGRITYHIEQQGQLESTTTTSDSPSSSHANKTPFFKIDPITGHLTLVRGKIPKFAYPPSNGAVNYAQPTLSIVLVANDNGTPRPYSTRLRVSIFQHEVVPIIPDSESSLQPSATVIVILIASVGFILTALVVSIICVRKRPLATGSLNGSTIYSAKYSSCPGPLNNHHNNNISQLLPVTGTTGTKQYHANSIGLGNNNNNSITMGTLSNHRYLDAEWNFQDVNNMMFVNGLDGVKEIDTQQQPQQQVQQQQLTTNQIDDGLQKPNNIINSNTTNAVNSVQMRMSEPTQNPNHVTHQIHPPLHHIASSRTSYEPIDAEESGDSGKGPSEDTRNMPYFDPMLMRNYPGSLHWKIPSPIPSSGLLNSTRSQGMFISPPPYSNNNSSSINPLSIFSLPRSPDYYTPASSITIAGSGGVGLGNSSTKHSSQVYDTPDAFDNSEIELSQLQHSNI